MTEVEEKWLKDSFAKLLKENLNRMAENEVLLEVVGDLICQTSGDADYTHAESVRNGLRERIAARQEKLLLQVESLNPSIAARMDAGNGPTPPPLNPPPV